MDDFELDVFEDELFLSEQQNRERFEPDWWLIATAQKESSNDQWRKSNEIFREFVNFSVGKDLSFKDLIDQFTLAKMQNKINKRG